MTVRARFTDAGAGVAGAAICYRNAGGSLAFGGGCQSFHIVSGDAHDGIWETTFTVPAGSASGTWTVATLGVDDVAGNRHDYFNEPPASQASFIVNGGSDTTPPTWVSASVSPSTVNAGSNVTVSARFTDAGTGVTGAAICYRNAGGSLAFGGGCQSFHLVSGDTHDGVWETTFTVPAGSASGTWTVATLGVDDLAGNRHDYFNEPPASQASFIVN